MRFPASSTLALALGAAVLAAAPAVAGKSGNRLPPASFVGSDDSAPTEKYVIGALDQLNVFVWRNNDLGGKVQVRPDGMITTPLIPDLQAAGKTPAQLGVLRGLGCGFAQGFLLSRPVGLVGLTLLLEADAGRLWPGLPGRVGAS